MLVALLTEPSQEDVLTDVFASDTSSLFITILAVIGITGEWRHHTITSSLLAAPDRLRFLTAKLIAFAVAGLVLSLLISIAITIAGLIILTVRDLPTPDAGELLEQIARNALVAALLGAFGVGIGALVRNQVVAVVGLLVLGFAVDPAVAALVPEVGRFSPFSALPIGITDVPPEDAGLPEEVDVLSPGLALLAHARLDRGGVRRGRGAPDQARPRLGRDGCTTSPAWSICTRPTRTAPARSGR